MKAKFTILGEPKGKGRPRVTKRGYAFTPKDTVAYENLVKLEYRNQCEDFMFEKDVQLDARVIAYYAIPKSVSKKKRQQMESHRLRPIKKPDCDNVIKSIFDSLNKIAYYDDSQVVDCQIRKFYSNNPRVVVTIQEAQLYEEV